MLKLRKTQPKILLGFPYVENSLLALLLKAYKGSYPKYVVIYDPAKIN